MGNASQPAGSRAALTTRLARDAADLHAAQRLRYEVFIAEMGGSGPMVDHAARLERDAFDPLFDHLLLVDTARAGAGCDNHVVGAYRLLPCDKLAAGQRFYCDDEFDLAPLRQSGRRLLELGRSCVHPAYRGGWGMLQMWQALADYAVTRRIDILFGAASFAGTDLGRLAHPLSWLHHAHLAPPALRVRARPPVPDYLLAPDAVDPACARAGVPALIKSYLRLGGRIGDGIFVDHAFRTTDVCILLDTARMSRHAEALAARVGPAA